MQQSETICCMTSLNWPTASDRGQLSQRQSCRLALTESGSGVQPRPTRAWGMGGFERGEKNRWFLHPFAGKT